MEMLLRHQQKVDFISMQPYQLRERLSPSWTTPMMLPHSVQISSRKSLHLLKRKQLQRWKREGQTFWIQQDGFLTHRLQPTLVSQHSTLMERQMSTQQLVESTMDTTYWRITLTLSVVTTPLYTSRSMTQPLSQESWRLRECAYLQSPCKNQPTRSVNKHWQSSRAASQSCPSKDAHLAKTAKTLDRRALLRLQSQKWRWLALNTIQKPLQWRKSLILEALGLNSLISCPLAVDLALASAETPTAKTSRIHQVRENQAGRPLGMLSRWSRRTSCLPWTQK